MKKQRMIALLLAVCLCLGLCACGGKSGGAYTLVETLTEGQYAIGFRNDDPAGDYVEAALKELAADGTIHSLEIRWFGDSMTNFTSDANALDTIGQPEPRTFIMGMDSDNFPMSYVDSGVYMGFDVELAREVCGLLGWELQIQEIGDESDAYVELSSGNVDCVWGGMMLDTGESSYRVICPYMNAGVVVVSLAGTRLNSMRKLEGKIIGMNDGKKYTDALAQTTLQTTAGEIKVTTGGNDKVFDSLYKGDYDAIITDLAAAKYYMR